jgi:hypothetical protein
MLVNPKPAPPRACDSTGNPTPSSQTCSRSASPSLSVTISDFPPL